MSGELEEISLSTNWSVAPYSGRGHGRPVVDDAHGVVRKRITAFTLFLVVATAALSQPAALLISPLTPSLDVVTRQPLGLWSGHNTKFRTPTPPNVVSLGYRANQTANSELHRLWWNTAQSVVGNCADDECLGEAQ